MSSRIIEILQNNRALHARRAKDWRKYADEEDAKVKAINIELRQLGVIDENDLEARQLDLVDHIQSLERDALGSTSSQSATDECTCPNKDAKCACDREPHTFFQHK